MEVWGNSSRTRLMHQRHIFHSHFQYSSTEVSPYPNYFLKRTSQRQSLATVHDSKPDIFHFSSPSHLNSLILSSIARGFVPSHYSILALTMNNPSFPCVARSLVRALIFLFRAFFHSRVVMKLRGGWFMALRFLLTGKRFR